MIQLDETGPAYVQMGPHPYYSHQPMYWQHEYMPWQTGNNTVNTVVTYNNLYPPIDDFEQ